MYSSRQLKAIARYHLGIAKYLFIHIPKNGGMAVRNSRAMRQRVVFADPYFHISKAYTAELFRVMEEGGHHHGAQHARLIDIRPDVRARLQPVAVVRNPFARTYSRFTFQYKYQERRGEAVDYSVKAFEAFLATRHEDAGKPYFWHRPVRGWYAQLDYMRDEAGRVACDTLRQEELEADIAGYFGVGDIPERNRSGLSAPPYAEVYTDHTRQIVADWYAEDIDHFGFDFIGPATRNVWATGDRGPAQAVAAKSS